MKLLIIVLGVLLTSCAKNQDNKADDLSPSNRSVETISGIVENQLIATGARHTCALFGNRNLWCWGRNDFGQLGNGNREESLSPIEVSLGEGRSAKAISAGREHTCVIRNDGVLLCWGRNDFGQLGIGSDRDSLVPVEVHLPEERSAKAISAGFDHTCAILDDDSLVCWGYNSSGQLGDGSTILRERPVPVLLPKGRWVQKISVGYKYTCAIFDDHSLYCWGNNFYGQLGNGGRRARHRPTLVKLESGKKAISLSAGDIHTCALLEDKSLACWGSNLNGRLGDGSTQNSHTPVTVKLPPERKAASVSVGDNHSCAILDDDTISCWGENMNGQLGNSGTSEEHTPSPVDWVGEFKVNNLDGHFMHTCAFLESGNLVCWGDNTGGQLGDGSREDRFSPVVVL